MCLRFLDLIKLCPFSGRTELETLDTPQEEMEFSDRVHNMVAAFGSEKAKRALSSARKNKIDTAALELTLSPAVNHVEKLAQGWLLLWVVYICGDGGIFIETKFKIEYLS